MFRLISNMKVKTKLWTLIVQSLAQDTRYTKPVTSANLIILARRLTGNVFIWRATTSTHLFVLVQDGRQEALDGLVPLECVLVVHMQLLLKTTYFRLQLADRLLAFLGNQNNGGRYLEINRAPEASLVQSHCHWTARERTSNTKSTLINHARTTAVLTQ